MKSSGRKIAKEILGISVKNVAILKQFVLDGKNREGLFSLKFPLVERSRNQGKFYAARLVSTPLNRRD